MKKLTLITLSVLTAAFLSGAQGLEISGMLRSQHAAGVEYGDFHEMRESLMLNLDYRGDSGTLHVSPYFHVNPLADTGDVPEWGVREAYIDLFWDHLDLRIGKQAVFWGQAEGAFITDVVSPQNLAYFILADFEEIRLGVPAVKATAFAGPVTLEAIWIQRFIPSILPEAGSVWRTDGMPDLSAAALPEATLENSEVFLRASLFGPRITLELVGGWGWEDLPVAEGSPLDPYLSYHRSLMAGGILSTTVGPVGVRAEGSVTLDKHYSLLQPGMPPSLVVESRPFIQVLTGLDGSLGDTVLSAQYLFQYIADYDENLVNQKEAVHTVTMRVQRTFLDQRLTASLFGYVGLDPLDSLLRPKVSFWIEDGLEVSAGADVFLGEEDGRFGVYQDRSQITAAVRWYF